MGPCLASSSGGLSGSLRTIAYTTTSGDGGVDDVTLTVTGRWIRIFGTQRGTQWGYSLWELEIYGYTT